MKMRYSIFFLSAAMALASCSKMNDNIDQYLSQGETIYIAKPDSVHLYAGENRFKIEFWMSDPRASSLSVYMSQNPDPIVVFISEDRDYSKPISMVADNGIEEGQYSLKLITHDLYGNTSIPDEENVNVYGKNYQASLFNRLVESKSVNGNTVTINWGSCYSIQEFGIRVWYTDIQRRHKQLDLLTSELGGTTVINDVDVSKGISYATMYLPETTSIDTFFAETVDLVF